MCGSINVGTVCSFSEINASSQAEAAGSFFELHWARYQLKLEPWLTALRLTIMESLVGFVAQHGQEPPASTARGHFTDMKMASSLIRCSLDMRLLWVTRDSLEPRGFLLDWWCTEECCFDIYIHIYTYMCVLLCVCIFEYFARALSFSTSSYF